MHDFYELSSEIPENAPNLRWINDIWKKSILKRYTQKAIKNTVKIRQYHPSLNSDFFTRNKFYFAIALQNKRVFFLKKFNILENQPIIYQKVWIKIKIEKYW